MAGPIAATGKPLTVPVENKAPLSKKPIWAHPLILAITQRKPSCPPSPAIPAYAMTEAKPVFIPPRFYLAATIEHAELHNSRKLSLALTY